MLKVTLHLSSCLSSRLWFDR